MNENYLMYGMMGVVLLVGLAGLYYMVNEPGMSGAFNLAGLASYDATNEVVFAPTADFTATDGFLTGNWQSPASALPSQIDTTSTIINGVNTPDDDPDVIGVITPVINNLVGYSDANVNFGLGNEEALTFAYNGPAGATLTIKTTGVVPPVFQQVEAAFYDLVGYPGTITTVYGDTISALTLTPIAQPVGTLNPGQFAIIEVYTIDNIIAQTLTGPQVFVKTLEVTI